MARSAVAAMPNVEAAAISTNATPPANGGDVTFGAHVQVVGDVSLSTDAAHRVPADTVLSGDAQ